MTFSVVIPAPLVNRFIEPDDGIPEGHQATKFIEPELRFMLDVCNTILLYTVQDAGANKYRLISPLDIGAEPEVNIRIAENVVSPTGITPSTDSI